MSADQTGYKKPPVKNQFKKGQSGNPKGRRKGSHNVRSAFESAIQRSVRLRIGQTDQQVSMLEAIFAALTATASKGNLKAIEAIIKVADKLQMLVPIAAGATLDDSGISSGTVWTEEDEAMRPYFEHLRNGPTRSSIFRGGLPDTSNQGKNPEEDKDDRS
jgi:Family of unknown function (DUF5681)